jgi:hypothetical protein
MSEYTCIWLLEKRNSQTSIHTSKSQFGSEIQRIRNEFFDIKAKFYQFEVAPTLSHWIIFGVFYIFNCNCNWGILQHLKDPVIIQKCDI